MENVARSVIKDKGTEYRKYHQEFCKKPLWLKICILLWNIPTHLYYTYWASETDKTTYKSLTWYLHTKKTK